MIYWYMYFPSKRDLWLTLLTWGILGLAMVPALTAPDRIGLYILIPTALFVGWIWLRTGYTIEGQDLKVVSGPFRYTVPIGEIRRMKKTRNPLSSPALSLDRIEISFGEGKKIMVSPADRAGFIRALHAKNPQMQIEGELQRPS